MKQLILNGAVRLLPAHLQARYAEQWQADMDGAKELGMSSWSVVWGAVLTSTSIAGNFEFTPAQKARTLAYRSRWPLAFSTGFLIALLFAFLSGGTSLVSDNTALSPWALFLLSALSSSIEMLAFALVFLHFFALGWALSTLVPSRFRLFTLLVVGISTTGGFFFPLLLDGIYGSANLPVLLGTWVLSLILLIWGKVSLPPSEHLQAKQATNISLLTTRICALLLAITSMVIYPLCAIIWLPQTIPSANINLSDFLGVHTVIALAALITCFVATRHAITKQGVLAIFGTLGAVAIMYSQNVNHSRMQPVIGSAHEFADNSHPLVLLAVALFLLNGFVISTGIMLAILPRIPAPLEEEHHQQLRLLKAA